MMDFKSSFDIELNKLNCGCRLLLIMINLNLKDVPILSNLQIPVDFVDYVLDLEMPSSKRFQAGRKREKEKK